MSRAPAKRPSALPFSALLARRETGASSSAACQSRACQLRLQSLGLSAHLEVAPLHAEVVTSLDLDVAEGRYLLSASADGSLGICDVQDQAREPGAPAVSVEPLAIVDRATENGHRAGVSSAQWFPHDTGLFVSGSFDSHVKLWDTNTLSVACDFTMPGRVHCVAMSPVSVAHTLVAACGEGSSLVTLCDPLTGNAAHTLSGHRGSLWTACWSPRHEHQLVSAGTDKSVRVWDVRRSGSCLRALDSNDTPEERRRLAAAPGGGGGGGGGSGRGGSGGGSRSGASRVARAGGGSGGAAASSTTVAAAERALATPTAHSGSVTSALFVADGLLLLTAGRDHRMRLWHAESGAHMLVQRRPLSSPDSGHS